MCQCFGGHVVKLESTTHYQDIKDYLSKGPAIWYLLGGGGAEELAKQLWEKIVSDQRFIEIVHNLVIFKKKKDCFSGMPEKIAEEVIFYHPHKYQIAAHYIEFSFQLSCVKNENQT